MWATQLHGLVVIYLIWEVKVTIAIILNWLFSYFMRSSVDIFHKMKKTEGLNICIVHLYNSVVNYIKHKKILVPNQLFSLSCIMILCVSLNTWDCILYCWSGSCYFACLTMGTVSNFVWNTLLLYGISKNKPFIQEKMTCKKKLNSKFDERERKNRLIIKGTRG